jgi:hypothetical protein
MPIDSTIHQLYIGYFGRPADKYGFNHWDAVAARSGIGQVSKAFAGSAEFFTVLSKSSMHVVETVFQNLFGRLPDQATRAFWIERLTRTDAALELFVSEMIQAAAPADAEVLAMKTAAAASFTACLDLLTEAENLWISSATFNATGQAYLAGVKAGASLDAALTGLVDTVHAMTEGISPPIVEAPGQRDQLAMTQEIQRIYIGYFGRPADPIGFDYWEHVLANHGLAPMRAAFALSTEFRDLTAGVSPAQVVNNIYLHSFGRPAEVAGLAYWVDLLAKGHIAIEQVIEFVQAGALGGDALILRNKVIAAASVTAVSAAVDPVPGWTSAESMNARAFLAGVTDEAALEGHLASIVEAGSLIGVAGPIPMLAAFS